MGLYALSEQPRAYHEGRQENSTEARLSGPRTSYEISALGRANLQLCFFDAPVGLIFTIHSALTKHSWLDYGLFLQTLMLAARVRGWEIA